MLITHCIEKIEREIRLLAWLPKCWNSSQVISVRWYVLQSVSSLIDTRVSMAPRYQAVRSWTLQAWAFGEGGSGSKWWGHFQRRSHHRDKGLWWTQNQGAIECAAVHPQHTYAWLSSAVAHTYSHYTQQQQKSLSCSTKLHSWKTKGIFWIFFIGSVQKYSRDVVLLLPLFWNTSSSFPSLILPSGQSSRSKRVESRSA